MRVVALHQDRVAGMRFGLSAPGYPEVEKLIARARWAEGAGFSTFAVSDHLDGASPFITLQAIGMATSQIGLATLVINNDFRHPAVLAQDAVTVNALCSGRLELGLGAGWARPEYERAGIAYDGAGTRIDRLAETVTALRTLFTGEPLTADGAFYSFRDHFVVPRPDRERPIPLLIGGNGDRLLGLAAEQADIVGFTGFSPDRHGVNVRSHFSRRGLADRVELVVRRAGGRDVELNVLVQQLHVTDDRDLLARSLAQRYGVPVVDVLTNPFLVMGTVEECCLQLTRLRDDLGITYVTVFDNSADAAAEVMASLAQHG